MMSRQALFLRCKYVLRHIALLKHNPILTNEQTCVCVVYNAAPYTD